VLRFEGALHGNRNPLIFSTFGDGDAEVGELTGFSAPLCASICSLDDLCEAFVLYFDSTAGQEKCRLLADDGLKRGAPTSLQALSYGAPLVPATTTSTSTSTSTTFDNKHKLQRIYLHIHLDLYFHVHLHRD
jgi:hypothetical protein